MDKLWEKFLNTPGIVQSFYSTYKNFTLWSICLELLFLELTTVNWVLDTYKNLWKFLGTSRKFWANFIETVKKVEDFFSNTFLKYKIKFVKNLETFLVIIS